MKKEKKLISKKEFFRRVNLRVRKVQALALLFVNIISVIFFLWCGACYIDVIAKNTACEREPLASWNFWQKVENAYYQNLPENN